MAEGQAVRGKKVTAFLPAAALAAASVTAHAELGGTVGSVETDRVRLVSHAARTVAAATHTSYTMTPAAGGSVVEYAGADGIVFAVSWIGPARPDLRQLLGPHFDTFQSDLHAQRPRAMQRRVTIRHANLVVHNSGHPGAFRGFAYLSDRLPQGFVADDLR